MSQRDRATGTHSAFTLIEVMVVVAIVGILAALAVPSMTAANDRRRRQELALQVEGALNEARDVARGELRCVTFAVDGTAFVSSTHPCAPVGAAPIVPYAASYAAGVPVDVDREITRLALPAVVASVDIQEQSCAPPGNCPVPTTHGFGALFEIRPDGSLDAPAIVRVAFVGGETAIWDVHVATGTVRRRQ